MASFNISASGLTNFIRSYHEDMIGHPDWGNGDSTNIATGAFYDCAEAVWGLGSSGGGYNQGEFTFNILDSGKLKSTGLISYGQVYR